MSKKNLIALAAACAFLSAPAFAAKPSFKCGKSSHEVEQLICESGDLAALDVSLASLYNTLMKHTPASQKKQLKAEQIGWVKGRDDCWKAEDKHACVKNAYESRIKELKDR